MKLFSLAFSHNFTLALIHNIAQLKLRQKQISQEDTSTPLILQLNNMGGLLIQLTGNSLVRGSFPNLPADDTLKDREWVGWLVKENFTSLWSWCHSFFCSSSANSLSRRSLTPSKSLFLLSSVSWMRFSASCSVTASSFSGALCWPRPWSTALTASVPRVLYAYNNSLHQFTHNETQTHYVQLLVFPVSTQRAIISPLKNALPLNSHN